jgi:alpha-galactosidase
VKNRDLLDMACLGRASVPVDLMTYRPEDKQPSIFLLKEDNRQAILTIFNWTEEPLSHNIALRELGMEPDASMTATDVLRGSRLPIDAGRIVVGLPAHSVRMIKLIETFVAAAAPDFEAQVPDGAHSGETILLSARSTADAPVLGYRWNFGDGVTAEGAKVAHTYTQPGSYQVRVEAVGLEGRTSAKTLTVAITGWVPTVYDAAKKARFQGDN